MNVKNVVICDRQFQYANSLAENILERKELSLRVYVCTGLDYVLQLQRRKKIHLFIVDESYSKEERKQIQAEQTFVLGVNGDSGLQNEESWIWKCQSADKIMQEIFEKCADGTQIRIAGATRKIKPRMIAVYSPIHRVGKSTFALALGKELAREKKVLYLNLEEYAGYEKTEESLNLGDLLYYMQQKDGAFGMRLQGAVQRDEVLDYIPPISSALDLKEVSVSQWQELLGKIVENSTYEQIILDVGECVQGLFRLLETCERVYMPVLMDEISQRKIRQYEETIRRLKLEKLSHITYRFVMPEHISEYAKLRAKEEG